MTAVLRAPAIVRAMMTAPEPSNPAQPPWPPQPVPDTRQHGTRRWLITGIAAALAIVAAAAVLATAFPDVTAVAVTVAMAMATLWR